MSKHILFVSYDGMTDPLGQSQVLPYLSGLSKLGYSFSLISFEKPDRFEKDEDLIRKICNEHQINWYPQQYTKRPPVLSTLFDLWKMQRVFTQIHKKNPVSLVHCRSYISAFVGLKQHRKLNIPWVFDMRGFWADERVEGNIWNIRKPLYKQIYRFFKRKEIQFFNESSAVISLTHAGKEELVKWSLPKLPTQKITVIPCCVDLKKFNPEHISNEQIQSKKRELGLENNRVLGYVGSIGTWYLLDEMLQTFRELSLNDEQLKFLFVTREPKEILLAAAQKHLIDPSKILVVAALHNEVPLYISLFDCSIFYIKPSFSKIASSPTKQGELMAMGIPMICNSKVGDSAFIVEKYHAGYVVDLEAKSSTQKFHSIDEIKHNLATSVQGAHDIYSLDGGISKYDLVYKSCL